MYNLYLMSEWGLLTTYQRLDWVDQLPGEHFQSTHLLEGDCLRTSRHWETPEHHKGLLVEAEAAPQAKDHPVVVAIALASLHTVHRAAEEPRMNSF